MRKQVAVALTVAGSDSGGGAGIQADLKTFAALGVHGTSAITCITAQNPEAVLGVEPCRPRMLELQLAAVFSKLTPQAVKSGMLFSAELIRVLTEFFGARNRPPLVVDPVMIASSGAVLLKPSAVKALTQDLLPLATLATPNLHEAEHLLGYTIGNVEELQKAARNFFESFGCPVLLKGGHLRDTRYATDVFFDGRKEFVLKAPFIRNIGTHGTGCTYSAAVTAFLARGNSLPAAVRQAKAFITEAIKQSYRVRAHSVLNTSWQT